MLDFHDLQPAWTHVGAWPRQPQLLPAKWITYQRKKEEKAERPIPRSWSPIQKFKRPGILAELLPRRKKHQTWGRIPTLPPPLLMSMKMYSISIPSTRPRVGTTSALLPIFLPVPSQDLPHRRHSLASLFQKQWLNVDWKAQKRLPERKWHLSWASKSQSPRQNSDGRELQGFS